MKYADVQAERGFLGAVLALPSRTSTHTSTLDPSDFADPNHAAVWSAILHLHQTGQRIDVATVADRLAATNRPDLDTRWLVTLLATQAGSDVAAANIIRRNAHARAVFNALKHGLSELQARPGEPETVAEDVIEQLTRAAKPQTTTPDDYLLFDELWALDTARPDWVIPDILHRGHRVIIVGPEGGGKSVLLQQITLATSQGIHPFRFTPIPPQRVLLVDVENSTDVLARNTRRVADVITRRQQWDPDTPRVLHRPRGLDLRSRADRADLEAVLADHRPDLVVAGPIYKLHRPASGENHETVAAQLMDILDDMRTRYDFALILEHHAPKGSMGSRELTPYGSSLWLRWPELGVKLVPARPGVLRVRRWRNDRPVVSWPSELHRSEPWPWTPLYDTPPSAPDSPPEPPEEVF
jgi:replicative DNA helicase